MSEEEDEQKMTEEEYQLARRIYSDNDQKSWEEDGKSEEEIRKFVEYEDTLTYEEKDKAREERVNVRESKESKVRFEQMMKPDLDKSDKELLIEIKDSVFGNWEKLGPLYLLGELRDNSNEIKYSLYFVLMLLVVIALALIYIAFNI